MEAVLREREASKRKSGRPPATPEGGQLLLTLEFWREYRTSFHLGQDWDIHETTVGRTVGRVEEALLKTGRFSISVRGQVALVPAQSPLQCRYRAFSS
ncbi:transposase family protein (plasmid) [Deinococcus radiomollis]|uniref:helix-turn-helix domain-containing protein n=1 Tax=Deinococcus radiomollis TaxID=468916 RepID=UPI0038927B82